MTKPVCIITGVGPGVGSALAQRFSRGDYHVALIARSDKRLPNLRAELPDCSTYNCDVTQEGQINETVAKITRDVGAPAIAIHNAVGGAFGSFLEVDPRCSRNQLQGQHDGASLPGKSGRSCYDRGSKGSHHLDRQHVGLSRNRQLRRVCTFKGGSTYSGGIDREASRPQREYTPHS